MTTLPTRTYWLQRWTALILTGVLAGLGGMLLALLLHEIQHLAYGYSRDSLTGPQTFLQGVTDASARRRFIVILSAGIVAGCGWWLLGRYGQKRVSISAAVKDPGKPMPGITTLIHALLQIITVAMGSPLGREVAPREVGSLFAGGVARYLRLTATDIQLMIACGAGAGLAAVYNVPLAGAVFTLEVLLVSFSWDTAIAALVTSALAAWIATLGLGDEHQYRFTTELAATSLVFWGALSGPVMGAAAFLFRRLTQRARSKVRSNWQMPVFSLVAFAALGALSIWFPQLPGNGKGPTQLTLDGSVTLQLALAIVCIKIFVIWAVLRGGAEGGLLTPGLTIGALLGSLLYIVLGRLFPGSDMAGFALTGAAGFLSASMQMPVTAITLMMEFTRMDHSFLVPLALCVTGAYMTSRQLERWQKG
ncbi:MULTISPECIES: chloride channel protein [Enterobacter]|uniref:chloride channel protein n=1 Tax=Enterobacter TaxID=547 RepID=UPI0028EEF38C|nr:chloride channel protein [Enterobacter cloacae]HDR2786198.1 chloride channel protein [Enterobacter asburiae]WNT37147.1 chloride channel protein [Enterobacter cloacae]HDR2792150.1 chloride channel protein [Enterobacter asburiae]HDR2797514.1 chloride channel protein [Enterobacter asburiae]HDR2802429.1 chloride channel protein [Enterobacter asburiae]